MIPVLRERAARQNSDRRVLPQTIAELGEAGLFRVLQPRRWGGYEMDPLVFADIQMALAEGDMSTAWVYGVVGVHAFQMALFDDRAAQDVWGRDNSVLIASTYMPTGKATPVEGGFRFTGRWKFSSGSEHCDWVFLGGLVNPGQTPVPDYRTFMLPKSDYRIEDTWHVLGLKGTGSQDIVVEDVFVPDYRVHNLADAYLGGRSPGQKVNDGALYRLPFVQVFSRVVSNACIGALQHFLDVYRDYGSKRIGTTGQSTAGSPDAQMAAAEALAAIDEMKLVLRRNFTTLLDYARRDEQAPVEMRLLFKYQSAEVAERCLRAVTTMFETIGGHGIYESYPFGTIYADLITAKQHISNQQKIPGRNLGAVLLGLENQDIQI
jgi:3-hydroxy-9,10-secoandrosta-1,3,5(10)-triene-9,17-dione monooxygenase